MSDLVLAVVEATFEALSGHFHRLLEPDEGFERERDLCLKLAWGGGNDLDDDDREGFAHAAISATYYRKLEPLLRGRRDGRRAPRGVDRHIWAADFDRKLRSLFPTGAAFANPHEDDGDDPPVSGRTRVSGLVQQALLRNRRVLQMDKATTAADQTARLFAPSPYYIAKNILTDPDTPTSEIYARAAIRTLLVSQFESSTAPLDLTYETISRALDGIASRASTSKRARARGGATREAGFLRNYLAAMGVMALEIEWTADTRESRIDRMLDDPANLFDASARGMGASLAYRLHPDHAELPDAGELLNELQGLPLPIEGAATIFHGGLRFASGGDIVAALSGPFGAGKTSACLSLAASLAPLGCRTVFLSCEEGPDDIAARLSEATPEYVTRSTPLFRAVNLDDMRQVGDHSPWFAAHKLRLDPGPTSEGQTSEVDVAASLQALLDDVLETSPLFEPFRSPGDLAALPAFARPVVVVDGFHQLFREGEADAAVVERSLRRLIDRCRERRAIFLFTIADDEPAMQRLDYLCDLVIQLDRTGFKSPDERVTRIFRLLKARRQPALTGAHIMHLSGPKGLRVKPSVSSHAQRSRDMRWLDPDTTRQIRLSDAWRDLRILNRSQTLVYGKGSAGKAGLGLYILNRRPLPYIQTSEPRAEGLLFEGEMPSSNWVEAPEPARRHYEARTLVVSFLYQPPYYRNIARRLRLATKRTPRTPASASLPNGRRIDVISLYAGGLTPEDFLAKIENQMAAAELRGLPYTGVLVDGIHNVFVQYPALQQDAAFWPQLYNMFRRRGVSVVTTHTEFELRETGSHARSLSVDFEHAQRKAAPLLSVLVSSADYVFELSAHNVIANAWEYRLSARSTLGEDPPAGYVTWNRQSCRVGDAQSTVKVGNP